MDEKIINFVKPFYEKKDIMHDLSHIKRVLKKVRDIAVGYSADMEIMEVGVYFHGMIKSEEGKIRDLLGELNYNNEKMDKVIKTAYASHKDCDAKSIEEKIVHDAHILEGERYFQILKSIITGTARGQSIEETIDYFQENILGKDRCFLEESKEILKEKEKASKDILTDLKKSLLK